MFSFKGDAHRFYLKLRKEIENGREVRELKEMREIKRIEKFYETFDNRTLETIRMRMVKEKSGNGIIPLLISGLPWLGFLLSDQLQSILKKTGLYVALFFIFIYDSTHLKRDSTLPRKSLGPFAH